MSSAEIQKDPNGCSKIYDAFAHHYRRYSEQKSAYIQSVNQLIIQRFGRAIVNMLDFGAGDGVRGMMLAKDLRCQRLVQGDISPEMLRRCQQLGAATEVWDLNTSVLDRTENFDLIVCLWNVLGHVDGSDARASVLHQLKARLAPGGRICFDVNNRHNRIYGRVRVLARRILDWVYPDPRRGDAVFDWEIDGVSYPAYGHLFTFAEVGGLLASAGLAIDEWCAVDYISGDVSGKVDQGHLFFVVKTDE